MEEIAELLRITREESGIDLAEVSNDLDINELYLKNIEDGKIGLFKDIFKLKEYISNYAKYLGLDSDKIINDFNEYLFEYTSKIPVKEIEKTIETINKEENHDKVFSPYTHSKSKNKKIMFIVTYILLFIFVVLIIYWSINQITVDNVNAVIASNRK